MALEQKKHGITDWFDYAVLEDFPEKVIRAYVEGVRREAATIAKGISRDQLSERMARHYLAGKMLLSATLMLSSRDYSESRNVLVADSYLQYYGALSAARALLLTMPRLPWNGGALEMMSHEKIINNSASELRGFDKVTGQAYLKRMQLRRETRELFSYRFPLSGPSSFDGSYPDPGETLDDCRLLADLAQLNSVIVEEAVERHCPEPPDINTDIVLDAVFRLAGSKRNWNEADAQRLDHIFRKRRHPARIWGMMTEGAVEDFFGAWRRPGGELDEDDFDPDAQMRMVFDFA